MCRLSLLGSVRVERRQIVQGKDRETAADKKAPRFRSRRTIGLLGYLVTQRRPISRDHLARFFWPDEPPSKGRANLSRELHNLAQILPGCWESDHQSVTFLPSAATTVDLYQLLELEAQAQWQAAADLLCGAFLEGLYLEDNSAFENWLLAEREHWKDHNKTILRHVIEGHTHRGRYTPALNHARRLLQLAPWDEEAQRNIMRLLAWTGQRGAALRQFENCRRLLQQELDIEPTPETITLYQQIKDGKLDLPPLLPAFVAGERARNKYERPPFVGREEELAKMHASLASALAGKGQVLFITGGPGQGKTALLETFTQQAMDASPNLLVAGGKCNAYSGVGDPYLPYRDLLAMLTGDVEGRWDAGAITLEHAQRLWTAFPLVVQVLLDHGPHLLNTLVPGEALLSRAVAAGQEVAPWRSQLRRQLNRSWADTRIVEQSHLFQQITHVFCTLSQQQPLLLILDDIQWADAASISLLFHLGRYLTGVDSKLLITCAFRPEEVALGRKGQRHPLAKVLSEFKRTFGDMRVDLEQTKESERRHFVDALLDIEPNRLGERFRVALFERTRGHPLFTVEILRALQERGSLLRNADGHWIEGPALDWQMLPVRVEAVIAERIGCLDPQLQDILNIASVEGELFTAQVIAQVQKVSERSIMLRLSNDLERRHKLVREHDEVDTGQKQLSRFQFSHILIQDYLYNRLSQGELRLLHGDIAVAIEALYAGRLNEMAVQLAQHYYHAADYQPAFHYLALAGDRAARLYESKEAIAHYTRAIQLAESVSPDVISLARMHRGRGLAFERVGAFERAHTDYLATLQIAHSAGEQQMEWRTLIDLGKLWQSRDYDQTREYFEAALDSARRIGDPSLLAVSLNWMGNWYANDDNPQRAVAYHQEALAILKDPGQRRELANTLDLLAIASMLGGDLNTSVLFYDQAIFHFRELDDRLRLVSSLTGRATTTSALAWLASVPANTSPDAAYDFEEALRIAKEIDSAPGQAWAHYSLGMLHTIHGQFGWALRCVQSSLQIASEIQHREYVVGARSAGGFLYTEMFAPTQALAQLEEALIMAQELRSPTWIRIINGELAGTYLSLGDMKTAQSCLNVTISSQTTMDTLGKRLCWVRQAELALAQDNPDLALDTTERLIASAPGLAPRCVVTYLWKIKAEALAAKGRMEEACTLLQSAVENAQETGERFLLWRLHARLAQFHHTLENQEAAEKEYATACALIDVLAATIHDETMQNDFRQGACRVLEIPP